MALIDGLDRRNVYSKDISTFGTQLASANFIGVDLNAYETSIQNTISNFLSGAPSNYNSNQVTFPIIFHLVVDHPSIISNDQNNITFNVTKLLQDINEVFSQVGVSFNAVTKDANGNNLAIPGINIIDASDLLSSNKSYPDNGISISSTVFTTTNSDPTNNITTLGYPINNLHDTYSWDNKEVINVFLINDFSQNTDLLLNSCNPYMFDNNSKATLNITLPFYCLGSSLEYGYQYTSNTAAQLHVFNSINDFSAELYANKYQYYGTTDHKAKVLLHGLGNLLGLAPSNTFNPIEVQTSTDNGYSANACNINCIYTDYDSADYCASCDELVTVNKIQNPLFSGDSDIVCDDSTIESLHKNIMNFFVGGTDYNFQPSQILRIRANLGMQYIDTVTSITTPGVLIRLLNTSFETYGGYPVASAELCDQVIDTNIQRVTNSSLAYSNIMGINTAKAEVALTFSKKIQGIKNLLNKTT